MKRLFGLLVAFSLVGCFATVGPDGRVVGGGEASFSLVLPTILPPLVVVEPGVSVVSDLNDEVFYSDGYYWAQQDRHWYRTRDHRRGWSSVDNRYVPAPIARSPPGQYRRYQSQPQRTERRYDDRGRSERRGDD